MSHKKVMVTIIKCSTNDCIESRDGTVQQVGLQTTLKVNPYISLIETLFIENKMQGCILSVIPTALVCVFFGPAMPSILFYAVTCVLFILVKELPIAVGDKINFLHDPRATRSMQSQGSRISKYSCRACPRPPSLGMLLHAIASLSEKLIPKSLS